MTGIAEEHHKEFITKLQEIREHLGSLRKDRTNYIRSEDVLMQYGLLCQKIRAVSHLDKDTDELTGGLSRSI